MNQRCAVEYEVYYEPWKRWFTDKAYPKADGGLSVFSRDITERKQADQALRRSEEHLELLSNTVPALISYIGLDRRYQSCNDAYTRWFGLPKEQIVGRPVREILGEEAWKVVGPSMERAFAGETVEFEAQAPYSRGGIRWIHGVYTPHRTSHGIAGVVVMVTDISQRKQGEQALARLAAIVDSSDDAIVGKDLDGIIRTWNHGAERLFGFSTEEAIGQPVFIIIPDDRIDEERDILARIRRGEPIKHFDTVRRRKDGRFIDISLSVSPIVDHKGTIIGASKIARDITHRKRAEEQLVRNQRLLFDLVERCPFGIYIVDAQFRIATVNAGSKEGAFRNVRPLIGRPFDEAIRIIWPAPVAAEIIANFRRTLETGEPYFSKDYVQPRADVDQVEAYEWELHRITLPDGQFGVVCYYFDSTRLRQTERELREATAKFGSVFNQSGIFAGIVDRDGFLREVNDLAVNGCGYSREEVLNRPFWETPWWRGSEAIQARIRAATEQAAAGTVFREELRYWDADGAERIADFAMHPIRDPSGQVILLHPTGIDITDRKLVDEALRDSNRRKDEFLATLAHELRNPLAPIRNALSVLDVAHSDRDTFKRATEMMSRQLAQMVRLIDDLLDVSRISRGKLRLRMEHVELASIVHQAVETCRPLADSSEHQLTVVLPTEPVYLRADPIRLSQVLSNLLNNSCKFTERGGRITLSAVRQGSDVVISVEDNGIGIAPEKTEGIFEMFAQADQSLEKAQGGLGIGLTLVKRLVELHGGSIDVRSEGIGRGSEFIVRLPVVAEVPRSEPECMAATTIPTASGQRILVVDDNRDSAISLAMVLQLTGNEAHTAHDGQEAVAAAEEKRPDVILLDIGLPKLNGYDVCRRIRQQPWGSDVVIIALTGWGQDEDKRKSREAGFNGHLVKPVDHAALMKLLASRFAEEENQPSTAAAQIS
jgi:PAS domain S-box-containing protein